MENIEQYQNSMNEIFKALKIGYKKEDNNLILTDGAVCPEIYFKEKKRVLFVLKDANQDPQETVDGASQAEAYIKYSQTGKSGWKTNIIMNRMVCMYEGLFGDRDISNIKKIAYVNIKKRPGNSTIPDKEVVTEIEKYGVLIKRQVEILEPYYMVCCGSIVFENMKKLADEIIDEDYSYCISKYGNKTIRLIRTYHPSSRVSNVRYKELFRENIMNLE